MNLWRRIKRLSIGQLFKLSLLFLSHPLLILPTLRATKKALAICDAQFGNTHHKSNKANAFRHALWNVLICKNTITVTKDKQKSVFWAQKVGDLYEKVTQNKPLDEAMDLHNNSIGRMVFFNVIDKDEKEIIHFLNQKTQSAKEVHEISEAQKWRSELIYLEK